MLLPFFQDRQLAGDISHSPLLSARPTITFPVSVYRSPLAASGVDRMSDYFLL